MSRDEVALLQWQVRDALAQDDARFFQRYVSFIPLLFLLSVTRKLIYSFSQMVPLLGKETILVILLCLSLLLPPTSKQNDRTLHIASTLDFSFFFFLFRWVHPPLSLRFCLLVSLHFSRPSSRLSSLSATFTVDLNLSPVLSLAFSLALRSLHSNQPRNASLFSSLLYIELPSFYPVCPHLDPVSLFFFFPFPLCGSACSVFSPLDLLPSSSLVCHWCFFGHSFAFSRSLYHHASPS